MKCNNNSCRLDVGFYPVAVAFACSRLTHGVVPAGANVEQHADLQMPSVSSCSQNCPSQLSFHVETGMLSFSFLLGIVHLC